MTSQHQASPAKTPDVLNDAQSLLLFLLEDLGSAATLLREACGNYDNHNLTGSEMCASDVVEIMGDIERRASELGASLARWIDC